MKLTSKWMELENVILSEVTQSQKKKQKQKQNKKKKNKKKTKQKKKNPHGIYSLISGY